MSAFAGTKAPNQELLFSRCTVGNFHLDKLSLCLKLHLPVFVQRSWKEWRNYVFGIQPVNKWSALVFSSLDCGSPNWWNSWILSAFEEMPPVHWNWTEPCGGLWHGQRGSKPNCDSVSLQRCLISGHCNHEGLIETETWRIELSTKWFSLNILQELHPGFHNTCCFFL